MSMQQIPTNWNALIGRFPGSHLLQTSQWAAVKETFGWQAHHLIWLRDPDLQMKRFEEVEYIDHGLSAAACVLERSIPLGLRVMYVPKGPLVLDWSDDRIRDAVWNGLEEFARQHQVIQLKMDPDVIIGYGNPAKENAQEDRLGIQVQKELKQRSWVFSREQIQYRNSVLVDLTLSEDDLLSEMKSKTRYNIRLAGRKGVRVRHGFKRDLDLLYRMYAKTALRAGFTIRSEKYYRTVWENFLTPGQQEESEPQAHILIAEVNGDPVAGAVIFRFQKTAYYIHGMSLEDHSEKMPSYLIQWESMRWAKSAGCTVYDMWGAPDHFTEDDPMWGVYRFKSGFGGTVVRTTGAWDFPVRNLPYQLYHRVLPPMLQIMRKFRNRTTENEADGGLS